MALALVHRDSQCVSRTSSQTKVYTGQAASESEAYGGMAVTRGVSDVFIAGPP